MLAPIQRQNFEFLELLKEKLKWSATNTRYNNENVLYNYTAAAARRFAACVGSVVLVSSVWIWCVSVSKFNMFLVEGNKEYQNAFKNSAYSSKKERQKRRVQAQIRSGRVQ